MSQKLEVKKVLGHRWLVLVVSFHKDSFCYSGTCICHDKEYDEKNQPYSLLEGYHGAIIQNAKQHGNNYLMFPVNENLEHHLKKLTNQMENRSE